MVDGAFVWLDSFERICARVCGDDVLHGIDVGAAGCIAIELGGEYVSPCQQALVFCLGEGGDCAFY